MSKTVKRVLYVDHTPFAGGAQLVLAEHITELDRQHFDPYIACSDTVPELLDKYAAAGALVKVVEFPRLRGFGLATGWKLIQVIRQVRRIIKAEKIDLVVSNTTRASYVATMATIGTKASLVWWVRDFLYPRQLFRLLSRFPVKIIFVSKAIQAAYLPPSDPRAEVVYVASSIYKQLPHITQNHIKTEKKRWGITGNELVVGFMGRLVADKGVEEVLEAARILHESEPKVKFLIVGTGKNQMNDVEGLLHQRIGEYGLKDVVVLTGYQSDEPLYYSLFDIFVLPTRDGEPFATSVVQAMMAGKAVIGSNAGGTPELVEDGVTGLLFEPRSASKLADAIHKLVADVSLRRTLAQTGQKRVLQYHREEVITDQVEAIFDQVLSAKQKNRK